MEVITIGLDIAKRVFQAHGVDAAGKAVLRRKLGRSEVLAFFERLPPCLVGIEACGTAHHWAREIGALGHEVRLMPPAYVKPYVKRGKTDAADAEAICEAVSRPTMRFVPIKSAEQQALLLLHRTRDQLVRQQTAQANALRGHMAEFGIIVAQGIGHVAELVAIMRGDDPRLPVLARATLCVLAAEFEALGQRIETLDAAVLAGHRANADSRRLAGIPTVGPLIASAFVATVGNAAQFASGRHFAAWLGLTPKQHSSGGKLRQGGICRAGDHYLRKLLVVGAMSAIRQARRKPEASWLKAVLERRPSRVAAVAVANKTARVIWALLRRGESYRAPASAASTAAAA